MSSHIAPHATPKQPKSLLLCVSARSVNVSGVGAYAVLPGNADVLGRQKHHSKMAAALRHRLERFVCLCAGSHLLVVMVAMVVVKIVVIK